MFSQNAGVPVISFLFASLNFQLWACIYEKTKKDVYKRWEIQGSCLPVMAQRESGWGTCERGASEL